MKVLVSGGAGFIGSHVVDALVERGYRVVVVDDFSTGKETHLNPEAKVYRLDIRDKGLSEIFEREAPDFVNHHAAQVNLRHSVADPAHDAQVNILGSLNLLENAVRYRAKHFLYISSGGAVYGEPERLPCDEEHPIKPLSPYGVSKFVVEKYLYLYRENHGLPYSVLRYPNIYGPRQDPFGEAGVVAIFAQRMLAEREVVINGTGDQERDFLYVSDCVEANLLAMEKSAGEVYNLGWGKGVSVNEIFARLKALTGYPLPATQGPPKSGETFKIYLDASRAQSELGWRPRVSLEEGLERTVAYFRGRAG